MFRTATVVSLALAAFASSYGAAAAPQSAVEAPSPDPQEEAAQREQRIKDRTERARREALFNRLDCDGDGYLSMAELRGEAGVSPESETLDRDEIDRDDDGRISRTEFAALELSAEDASRDEPPQPPPGERP